jgi:hypothetical protein
MADPARHVQFNANNNYIIVHYNQDNNDDNDQNNDQAIQPHVPAAAPAPAQTAIMFKVEQSKIPEF